MDLMYLVNAGFALDMRIIFKTVQILFLKESTEGVEETSGSSNIVCTEGKEKCL